ncbi:hypothetical protein KC366_g43 [Hortaea werneckii]|nr:hypothetical protein KC366_g43 [Hortaea werneckii]
MNSLTQNVLCRSDIALVSLDMCEDASYPCPLDFNEDLSHYPLVCQPLSKTDPRYLTFPSVTVRRVSITLNFLSISGTSSKKPMTTCTIFHLLVQQRPIATLLTYRHDLDYDSGGGWEVRRLTGLLFQPE